TWLAVVHVFLLVFFFFQAEDGIRYRNVTGVQTCALPICQLLDDPNSPEAEPYINAFVVRAEDADNETIKKLAELWHSPEVQAAEIGRASCRERASCAVPERA